MASTPSTQDEWTIHALNIHGVFFERICETLVANTIGWRVLATNYPVEFPPSSGPWRGKESCLDLWARRDNDSQLVVDALIECKKANPDFVNWVFFPKMGAPTDSPVNFRRTTNMPKEESAGSWSSETAVAPFLAKGPLANDAREVPGNYRTYHDQGKNKTKTSNAAIQEAASQVALGTMAIVHEENVLLLQARKSPEHLSPPWVVKVYIPLIVTTANLFLVRFNPESVKLNTGEIDFHDAILSSVQSLFYEYALPKHLQVAPNDPSQILQTGNREGRSRMHIIVVHADELTNCLRGLDQTNFLGGLPLDFISPR